jgi:hypothetical protein
LKKRGCWINYGMNSQYLNVETGLFIQGWEVNIPGINILGKNFSKKIFSSMHKKTWHSIINWK